MRKSPRLIPDYDRGLLSPARSSDRGFVSDLLSLSFNPKGYGAATAVDIGERCEHDGRYGLRISTPRRSAYLPRLALPMLRAPSRRALRADRGPAYRRRHGPFAGPPEPRACPPARLGQPLRRSEPRAHRRRALARAVSPARHHYGGGEPCPGIRRGCERLESLRRRGQPGATTTTPRGTRPGSPSLPAGPTSWSPGFPSSEIRGCRP